MMKTLKYSEKQIQRSLFYDLNERSVPIIVPNISYSWLYWEADLISISKAGYMSEFEIKISKSDFLKDFKKRKHISLTRPPFNHRIPNYFWYVAPLDAIPICIPSYAGLKLVKINKYNNNLHIEDIKKAPLLHKIKVEKRVRLQCLEL